MLQTLVVGAMFLLGAMTLFQGVYVMLYARHRARNRNVLPRFSFSPKTAVILCLRGKDPGLTECLNRLSELDYQDFELHVVFDCLNDPSNRVVSNFVHNDKSRLVVHTHVIDPIQEFGSLKCQAISQTISTLADDVEAIVLVDADAIVDSTWLTNLVQPLGRPGVGAATGNRWFTPTDQGLGSWVRTIWNAAAVVQMQLYNIAWGGSLAIKTSVIRETGLLEKWKMAFCEDTMLTSILKSHDLNLVRVPEVIVDNEESSNVGNTLSWITRQLLTVRLYHQHWPFVLGHACCVGLCGLGIPIMFLVCMAVGKISIGIMLACAWLVFQVVNALLIQWITRLNTDSNGAKIAGHPKLGWFDYAIALVAAQIIQPIAAVKAAVLQNVRWRDIEYKIQPDSSVAIIDYQPYRQMDAKHQSIQ